MTSGTRSSNVRNSASGSSRDWNRLTGTNHLPVGVAWLKRRLSAQEQQRLADACRHFLDGPAGGYVPTVRGGGRMRVRMLCLGRHWNPLTYRYEATRADFDNAAVPPLPEAFASLAA